VLGQIHRIDLRADGGFAASVLVGERNQHLLVGVAPLADRSSQRRVGRLAGGAPPGSHQMINWTIRCPFDRVGVKETFGLLPPRGGDFNWWFSFLLGTTS
jgi:hypothetical protein